MDYQEIRRASIILGIGYACLMLYSFITLKDIPQLKDVTVVKPAFYIGFTLLTVGSFLAKKEHKYFKASFISFLCLDVLLLAMIVISYLYNNNPTLYTMILKIIFACNNAFLALANGLFTNGMKEVFARKRSKKCMLIQ